MQSQINILQQYKTKKILAKIKENYGASSFPENSLLAMRGKEKIYLFTGNLDEKQIKEIESAIPIEGVGVYFCKVDENSGEVRLSLEGVHLLKNQITKNIIELNSASEAEEWMMGRELLWEDLIDNSRTTNKTSETIGWDEISGGTPSKSEKLGTLTKPKGFVVIKYKNDFLGCGKASENKISNFIPKSRRLKERN